MDRLTDLQTLAGNRANELKVSYAGSLTPKEAHELLSLMPSAKLIDVRTKAECDWVGRVPGAVEIELMGYPGNALNALFAHQVEAIAGKDAMLLFLCRSGGRSNMAATSLTASGFTRCYNVLEGFEGDKDAASHRNTKGGWRAAALPWVQS